MENLKSLQAQCKEIAFRAHDDAISAIVEAGMMMTRAEEMGSCALSAVLGVRGSAWRMLGDFHQAESDLAQALRACDCMHCGPEIRRREAWTWIYAVDATRAVAAADAAVAGFLRLGDEPGEGRARLARAAAYCMTESFPQALEDARLAERLIPPSDGAHYASALQILAVVLTYSGGPEHWREALDLLRKCDKRLRNLNGSEFRSMKIRLRWVRILAEVQLGVGRNHGRRIHEVFRDLAGLGVRTRPNQPEEELERARRAARAAAMRNPLETAALVADMGLLGARRAWIEHAAQEAHDVQIADSAIARRLACLSDAARRGEDLRPYALAVRAECPNAPALPPRLSDAA